MTFVEIEITSNWLCVQGQTKRLQWQAVSCVIFMCTRHDRAGSHLYDVANVVIPQRMETVVDVSLPQAAKTCPRSRLLSLVGGLGFSPVTLCLLFSPFCLDMILEHIFSLHSTLHKWWFNKICVYYLKPFPSPLYSSKYLFGACVGS